MVGRGYIDEHRQLKRLVEREACVNLLGRERIFAKLISKGYKSEDVSAVIDELISSGEIDFEASKKKLINKKLPENASGEEIRKLLYKYGHHTNFS